MEIDEILDILYPNTVFTYPKSKIIEEEGYNKGFKDGFKLVKNSNKKWHKTKINSNKYDLPDKIGGCYNIILENYPNEVLYGKFYGNYWNIEGKSYPYYKVIAWIKLPEPPKFD